MSEQKILIVDDEEDIQIIVGTRLEIEGFSTVQAKNLKEAWDVFEIHKATLSGILMDGNLNSKYTIELVQEIRKMGFQNPIIAFSGNEGTQLKLMAAGCSHRIDGKGGDGDFVEKVKQYINF